MSEPLYDSFADIHADITQRIADGTSSRHSACHHGIVATSDADARVMILRGWDVQRRTLRFHTDSRSPKCALIGSREEGGAPVGVLFYDKAAKIQMRCRGTGWIETDSPIANAAWEASTTFARRCYLGEGPGSTSDVPVSGLPDWADGIQPSEDQVAPARANFAVLLVKLAEVDWLFLSNNGHRRALIDMTGSGACTSRWITP